VYAPFVLAIGARATRAAGPGRRDQSFSVLSPKKVILRTSFLAHERVQFPVLRYFLTTRLTRNSQRINEADRDVF
jgi:hypothetical protein